MISLVLVKAIDVNGEIYVFELFQFSLREILSQFSRCH